jgi:hypothetical protein
MEELLFQPIAVSRRRNTVRKASSLILAFRDFVISRFRDPLLLIGRERAKERKRERAGKFDGVTRISRDDPAPLTKMVSVGRTSFAPHPTFHPSLTLCDANENRADKPPGSLLVVQELRLLTERARPAAFHQ